MITSYDASESCNQLLLVPTFYQLGLIMKHSEIINGGEKCIMAVYSPFDVDYIGFDCHGNTF